jgi:hypothetical protein
MGQLGIWPHSGGIFKLRRLWVIGVFVVAALASGCVDLDKSIEDYLDHHYRYFQDSKDKILSRECKISKKSLENIESISASYPGSSGYGNTDHMMVAECEIEFSFVQFPSIDEQYSTKIKAMYLWLPKAKDWKLVYRDWLR